MATKRLARTVIEGGRRNVWERRSSTQEERAEVRMYLERCEFDPEFYDDEVEPERRPVGKEFSDKLRPMTRWLEKQVGRVWDDVRSEIFATFDTRTTAGRHITFDHLLRDVVDTESGFDKHGYMADPAIEVISNRKPYRFWGGSFNEFYVDQEGILRQNGDKGSRRRRYRESYATAEEVVDVAKWLNYRIIGIKDGVYCWFAPTEGIWKAEWLKSDYGYAHDLKYYLWDNGEYTIRNRVMRSWGEYYDNVKKHGNHWEEVAVPFSYRQSAPLNSDELKYFNGLKERVKRDILSYGKGR